MPHNQHYRRDRAEQQSPVDHPVPAILILANLLRLWTVAIGQKYLIEDNEDGSGVESCGEKYSFKERGGLEVAWF